MKAKNEKFKWRSLSRSGTFLVNQRKLRITMESKGTFDVLEKRSFIK
jgi:hypothetical protein